jgi:hypothetical protein
MLTTKYQDTKLTITMPDDLKKSVVRQGVNHLELYRLLESFAGKLLKSKKGGSVFLENEDTGARLEADVKWAAAEKEVVITIVNVDMTRVKSENLPNRPKGAKFDFTPPSGSLLDGGASSPPEAVEQKEE